MRHAYAFTDEMTNTRLMCLRCMIINARVLWCAPLGSVSVIKYKNSMIFIFQVRATFFIAILYIRINVCNYNNKYTNACNYNCFRGTFIDINL